MTDALLIVNNVPTPYRAFLFNQLSAAGAERGVQVEVLFQARRLLAHPEWSCTPFEHQFVSGVSRSGISFGREERAFFHHRQVHWDILRAAASGRYRWVLFSPYMGATGVLLGLMPLLGTKKLLWSESNRWSTGPTSPAMRWLKWALAHRFHAIAVPGERAAEHLYAICPALRARVTIRLPNLVDSTVFRDRVAELQATAARGQGDVGP